MNFIVNKTVLCYPAIIAILYWRGGVWRRLSSWSIFLYWNTVTMF